ncbi:MAG: hydroxyethylthiazole kinase [Pseudomonadota bacterium]
MTPLHDREALVALTTRGLHAIRETRPLVHGLTNSVAQAFTANILLSLGAIPTMTGAAEEVADFVGRAGAVYVNLGTLDAQRRAGIDVAVEAATARGVPWVLDPAHCESSPSRIRYAEALLARGPAFLRLNAAEASALFGEMDAGVITKSAPVALTGQRDRVSDGRAIYTLANGHPLQARVTAIGCAGTAIIAAFLAVGLRPLDAALAGLTVMNVAAERAAEQASGPGSFAVALVDALYHLDGEAIASGLRFEGAALAGTGAVG